MSFFENVSKRMAETGQAAMQKARTVSETTKLNVQISELQKSIQALYARIGEQYFKLHADTPEAALAELVDAIRQAESQISQCRDEIAKLSNAKTCPSCGAVLDNAAAFCSSCGAAVPVQQEQPAEPEPQAPVCAACGAALVPGNRFCTKCGTPVPEEPAPVPESPMPEPAPQEAPASALDVPDDANG